MEEYLNKIWEYIFEHTYGTVLLHISKYPPMDLMKLDSISVEDIKGDI
mgnify:CR=1 FL=1